MKNTILSLTAAFALLASTTASAASIGRQDGPRNGNNSNYGYDRNHQVTPEERAKWEAQHKNDRNDRHDDKKGHDDRNDHHDDKKGRDKDDGRGDKKDHDKNDRGNNGNGRGPGRNDDGRGNNYGYDRNHQVTPQERAAWEAQHRNDHR